MNKQYSLSEMKARQSAKIRQLAATVGMRTIDELAVVLGVPRSTAATIRNGQHKASGLSAGIIKRIFAAPYLPEATRVSLQEYVTEKACGLYGAPPRRKAVLIEECEGAL
jgi:hypothetical protein